MSSLSHLFVVCSGCSKNQAPWDALKLDNVYNLSDALDYKDVSCIECE